MRSAVEKRSRRDDDGQPLALPLRVNEGVLVTTRLSFEGKTEIERKYKIIAPLIARREHAELWRRCGGRKTAVVAQIAKDNGLSERTLWKWYRAWKRGGLAAMAKQGRSDKGQPKVENAQRAIEFFVEAAFTYGRRRVKEIERAYNEERNWRHVQVGTVLDETQAVRYRRYLDAEGRLSPDALLPKVSRGWIGRRMKCIPQALTTMACDGEEAFSNTQEIISHRDLSVLKPLEWVCMDHRTLDLFCLVYNPVGYRLVRPYLTAALDLRTRKWLSWTIIEQPSSDSIATTLKRLFLDYGVPGALYWDNGKDFRCQWLEGRRLSSGPAYRVGGLPTGTHGVLGMLGVPVHHARPYGPRSKPIEAALLATSHFDSTLPWWCGRSPGTRPERFEELLTKHEAWLKGDVKARPFPTIEEVAGIYDQFLRSLNDREHTGVGMEKMTPTGPGWMTPNECWDALIGSVERRTISPEQIQFCFHKRRQLTVRNGEVRASFGGRLFYYRLADNSIGLAALNGTTLDFAYDPYDLGTAALYHQNTFLGLATNVELRRFGEDAFISDERARRAMRREVKAYIRRSHQSVYVPDQIERLSRRMAVAPVTPEPARAEVPIALPAPVEEAVAAAAAEKSFRFTDAGADVIRVADAAAYRDDDPDDGDFQFFSRGARK